MTAPSAEMHTRSGRSTRRSPPAVAPPRLTGRGTVLAFFGFCFVAILVSGWLRWSVLAGGTFLVGCAAAAWYVRRGDLLPVTVCPPLVFCAGCVCANALTSSGTVSAAAGTLITLADSAPWLFAGTALAVLVALRRGLLGELRALRVRLHGAPDTPNPRAARPPTSRRLPHRAGYLSRPVSAVPEAARTPSAR